MKTTLLFLLLFAFSFLTLQGQVLVNGQVKSADGELLLGVNVSENGTTNGTATDIDGNFSLEISNPNAVLHFSYIGYSSLNVEVGGQTTLQVIMEEGVVIGEVQVVGSRSYNRTMTNSPVAVDIIDVANLTSTNGRVEINQILQYAAPSFNATKQSGS
ncbi:MAG TPA: carboxypeptidase-like regulatory domain-containing protein, partial [Saprospiraceae bacterium]|nr:carboxypeptidase-like regulatory domain-containing protein [Saprospiraceae bacterium]